MLFPKIVKIKQKFNAVKIDDVRKKTAQEVSRAGDRIKPGDRIAVAVGSRGIKNLQRIVSAVIGEIKKLGGDPFIVPAMGSHGNATPEGQKEVLALYGITEELLGVPVLATMETVCIGKIEDNIPVYIDKIAAGSDGIVLINRVKPHTDYHGPVESGIRKMIVIGLGKQKGAELVHFYGTDGLINLLPRMTGLALQKLPVLFGLAVLENSRDETAEIIALRSDEIEEREPALLSRAKDLMPRLPVNTLDVLVVTEMGKNISGVGMDPNITGRMGIRGQKEDDTTIISRIVALDLTPQSHGNALGMGLADVITQRFRDKVDLNTTYANVITSGFLERGFMPMVMPGDHEAIDLALKTCGRRVNPDNARLMIIKNTLELEEAYVSTAIFEEARSNQLVEVTGDPEYMLFDQQGSLITRL